MRSLIAKVTVSVVISVLSAAGSNIVPRTERMLNRRATHPSTFEQNRKRGKGDTDKFSIQSFGKGSKEHGRDANQVCQSGVGEQ
jgi:hypothetical protein